jgi:proteasome lid subunit RPN8/RPN11
MKLEEKVLGNVGLIAEVLKAKDACANPLEEEGGVILCKDEIEFEFIKLKNKYHTTATAIGLYEADTDEFSDKVIPKIGKGWKMFASFHTHPTFPPRPSQLDVTTLFMGFKYNFIYSPLESKHSCSIWEDNMLTAGYVDNEKLEQLVENYVR